MKRDWDLIREILLALEELPDREHTIESRTFAAERNLPGDFVAHQFRLLLEAGMIDGKDVRLLGGSYVLAFAMTMPGHELLDQMRTSKVWRAVKAEATKRGIDLTFDSIAQLYRAVVTAIIAAS